ncbi:MAG: hypothetical protein K1X94_16535 [Sandaracinaceae bacterium]|nr:hypothetical protein [Sandaracinaceae bacterium]
MRRVLALLLAVPLPLAACSPTTSVRRGTPSGLDAYCEVTSTPGLVRFDGEVATICEGGGCMVARVRGSTLTPLPVSGAAMGFSASRGRTVILHDDARLTILEGSDEVELARWAADVSVEDDGDHVLFVGLREADTGFGEDVEDPETGELTSVPGASVEMTPEMGTRLVRLDLDTAELEELVDDPMAGTPIALPGTDDILFVGAPDGVAALLRLTPGTPARQLTNVGVLDVGQEFVPVPQHEYAVIGGRVVYSVIDRAVDLDERDGPLPGAMWAVDVSTGEAELLGGGRFPMPSSDGVIAAAEDTPGGGCASTYASTEGP